MRFSRRLVALAVVCSGSAFAALWGCSTPDNHPPIIGDCSGNLCPPAQGQGLASGSSSGNDAGVVDSGGGVTDAGSDTGLPLDSGGD